MATINHTPVPDARLNMKIRSLFLDHLALPSTARRAWHLWQFCNISGYWAY
jgi:hypothetical protein